ncbi:hypothetical protein CPB86DRAFT_718713 [Serendipita vermifera]|nr:hypothetical protein CPB86DRAFT_718713 [Serendipita vermifera]
MKIHRPPQRNLPECLIEPSSVTIQQIQGKYGEDFDCGRPPNPESIPLALLHNVFGEFLEDVQSCTPNAKDNQIALELWEKMTQIYKDEATRAQELRDTWEKFLQPPMEAASMGTSNYSPDGHLRMGNFVLAITVVEKELKRMTTDPLIEATEFYLQGLQSFKTSTDLFPCLFIYSAGPYIGFAGAVWSTKIQVEVLTPFYALHGNIHQRETRSQVAKALAATRRAITALESHYNDLKIPPKAEVGIGNWEPFPYRTYYEVEGQDSQRRRVEITYQERIYTDKLLFTAKDTEGNSLFIKFTHQYSAAAHKHCAEHGVAPALHAVEDLPGRWFMVVMDYLDDEVYDDLRISPSSDKDIRLQLYAKVKQVMETLHSGGFVHGDFRKVNLKVRKNWKESTSEQDVGVMLVDFDWAGKAGEARYPANVNHRFYRPKGVEDGALIEQDHDVAMVDHMFKGLEGGSIDTRPPSINLIVNIFLVLTISLAL